ncbi:unnamed protein product [marine sediment metagenome]|uniref:Uncharacterized protein n=1 Tax=marine sediment metagenome TaxID=412755 RepID=X0SS55_9ZZZZ
MFIIIDNMAKDELYKAIKSQNKTLGLRDKLLYLFDKLMLEVDDESKRTELYRMRARVDILFKNKF